LWATVNFKQSSVHAHSSLDVMTDDDCGKVYVGYLRIGYWRRMKQLLLCHRP